MEFKFRGEDLKPPSYQFPSSRQSYFSDHSFLRGGFPSVIPVRNTNQMLTPNDAGEEMMRELEKEQIRREIISGEIARRRMLEEEVRRELMVERELALRRNLGEKFLFDERLAMGLNPRLNVIAPYDNRPLEERTACPNSREYNSLLTMPRFPQLMDPEIKPAPQSNKDKLIILAKPDPDVYRAKRKAVTPPAVDGREHCPFGLKKKPKEDWSCALCRVSATSERSLNEHLQGKKHKAKESALRMQKIGKSASSSFSSKKSEKSLKPTETIVTTTSGLDAKADGRSPQVQPEVTREGINQTVVGKDREEIKIEEEGLVQEKNNAEDSEKQNGTKAKPVGKPNAANKRKFKVWCEFCQVGSFSEIVMENHKKGKKHINRLKKFGQNDGSALPTSTVLLEATPLTRDTNTANNIEKDLMTTSSDRVVVKGFPNPGKLSPAAKFRGDRVVGEL